MIVEGNRKPETDKWVNGDLLDEDLQRRLFTRLGAKNKRFKNVNFKYSIFDNCYLRNCVFDSCDFTGVKEALNNHRHSLHSLSIGRLKSDLRWLSPNSFRFQAS